MPGRPTIVTCVALSPSGTAVAAEGVRMARLLDAEPVFLHVGADTPATRLALADRLAHATGGARPTRTGC